MRTLIIVLAGSLFYAPGPLAAQSPTESDAAVLGRAQAAFRQGVAARSRVPLARKYFSYAADAYLELHRREQRSPPLYRCLGDAALLADRWPEAIWAYHMGLRLDPNDRAMREHLDAARGKVLYSSAGWGRPEEDSWPNWLHRPTLFELTGLFALLYFLAWAAGTGAAFARNIRLVGATMVLVPMALLVGAWLALELDRADSDQREPLAIVAENTPLYRGNGTSYPQHSVAPRLPRGLEVRVVNRRGSWRQVRLSTGEVGWLPVDPLLIVEP